MRLKHKRIEWQFYPETEKFILKSVNELVGKIPELNQLKKEMAVMTATSLIDWVDHIVISDGNEIRNKMDELGFLGEEVPVESEELVYYHPGAVFPRILLKKDKRIAPGGVITIAVRMDKICEFLLVHRENTEIEGTPLSPYRRAKIRGSKGKYFLVVERRGHRGFVPVEMKKGYIKQYLDIYVKWALRERNFDKVKDGMKYTLDLVRSIVEDVGRDTAAHIIFDVERKFWQQRNKAVWIQKSLQDSIGLGWANYDHHTFRSSRNVFHLLIEILETLGFISRERFYAGVEAGWGAQVMEQSNCGLVVFAEVDLNPDEVDTDFANEELKPTEKPGTVGLWCNMHGESILNAGLHRIAIKVKFNEIEEKLNEFNIKVMKPFSNYSYLKQAFSFAEKWYVNPVILKNLENKDIIDSTQRKKFEKEGVSGSHIEIIQRTEGFKGFNQKNVSDIIKRTDPRI